MSIRKANMWRTAEPLTAPARAGVRRVVKFMPTPGDATANNPNVATNIAEQRFGSRADKLLRRFSWEDGE